MKVMCINWYPSIGGKDGWAIDEMYIGRILNVIDSKYDGSYGLYFYEFAEYPGINWMQENFAPISEIDEREMERKEFYAGSKSGLSFLK